jgi:Tat protein translocase TatC
MPLGAHLEELRTRVVWCLIALGAATLGCWFFREILMDVLTRPHVQAMRAHGLGESLKYSSYFEPVVVYLKLCIFTGFVLASPVVIYNVWAFIAPGLFPHEKFRAVRLGAACLLCLGAGIAFGYYIFVPIALRYLLNLSGASTEPVLMIGSYFSTFFLLTLALGLAFQTPVVVFYLMRWGVLDAETHRKVRGPVILGAFVVAAVLTPPDPLTQIMMGLTLVILYDIGGLLAAPSRATFFGFARFAGAILAILLGVLAWLHFAPVAEVQALEGEVAVGARSLWAGDDPASVMPRRVVEPAEGGLAEIRFDSGAAVYLDNLGRAEPGRGGLVRLEKGILYAVSPGEAAMLEVRTRAAVFTLAGARAEFSVPEPGRVRAHVFRGRVEVQAGPVERVLRKGEQETFVEDEPESAPLEAEQTWRRRIGREE